ncbi:hypothetical protein [Candidatus Thiodictyon syntrophicum]|jgi:hypothetical protein|uniref:Uncharacterized protein n=1 Tax=Candidatus Thiodictyon syntrophicum TaxID=1166950 RepID=A0A2K8U4R5_9GAMM|nr:hypothetical protein [Candidatus Thiodictyon syntrophicum]AUB80574.1 hypothetical protein THSYN_06160 [Candidatus Thiodictyon syntrophicum]
MADKTCPVCGQEQEETAPACTRCNWDFSPLLGTGERVRTVLSRRLEEARTAWRQRRPIATSNQDVTQGGQGTIFTPTIIVIWVLSFSIPAWLFQVPAVTDGGLAINALLVGYLYQIGCQGTVIARSFSFLRGALLGLLLPAGGMSFGALIGVAIAGAPGGTPGLMVGMICGVLSTYFLIGAFSERVADNEPGHDRG